MAHHTTTFSVLTFVIYASCHAAVITTPSALVGVCTFPNQAQQNPTLSSTETPGCQDFRSPPDGVRLNPSRHSTCPWYYVINYDANRVPAYIPEATCSCRDCIDPYDNMPNDELTCMPVEYPMKVLVRKESSSGDGSSHEYEVEDYQVAVSCACMRLPE
ncbi:Interleukin-17D [Holothuria leucospilota]|uniref:Interleukin-17D n=1 Tax=Holothuria leucospilota TaxID=206669 RepID=A0A9Q1HCH1_HOLLE|nr:Interleukin-17D [Holothuria leucospilota]